MKALAKLVADFVAWRWAPTVAILSAAFVYVVVVVGLVPSEIQVPITNPRFQPRPATRLARTAPRLRPPWLLATARPSGSAPRATAAAASRHCSDPAA
jgi:hypothetical protein